MTRVISGVALAAATLAAILFLPVPALRVVSCVVAGLAAHEYLRIAGPNRPRGGLPIAAVVLSCAVTSAQFDAHFDIVLGVVLVLVAVGVLVGGWGVQDAAASAFASVYIGVPLGLLVAIHGLYGWQATLLLVGTVVISDSAQFYSGRSFGRRLLAPAISPKKTVEGAVGGIIVGTAFMAVVASRVLPFFGAARLVALGLVVVICGICGDLFESRLKRSAGVKDSSLLIPGHGGVLDRIDALLFAIPPFYAYLRVAGA
jgi:phosphatidate cytidylyltransferase